MADVTTEAAADSTVLFERWVTVLTDQLQVCLELARRQAQLLVTPELRDARAWRQRVTQPTARHPASMR